ncbi:MAG: hypothetical protein CNLJKLNK_00160 [Holosporales bacterium]
MIKNLNKLIFGFCAFSAIKAASVETQCVAERFDASRTSQEKTVAQCVEAYWQDSRLRFIHTNGPKIKDILLKLPKWPGGEVIRSYEQLFWMLPDKVSVSAREPFYHLLENSRRFNFEIITNFKRRHPLAKNEHAILICLHFLKSEDQDQFVAWIGNLNTNSFYLLEAIKLYKKFSALTYAESFINWCQKVNITLANREEDLNQFINEYKFYHRFDTDEEREHFMQWVDENPIIDLDSSDDLLALQEVYYAFDNHDERNLFVKWVRENSIIDLGSSDNLLILREVYRAFDNHDERKHFIQWAKENSITQMKSSYDLLILQEVYCAFDNNHERNLFEKWAEENSIIFLSPFCNLQELKNIYCAFNNNDERERFVEWTK